MSLIQMNFFSEMLNMFTPVNVILPQPRDVRAELRDLPALYLLHGMGDDYSSWLRKTAIERYALAAGLAVIMPDGALSYYENMAHGARYRDYIGIELPRYMRQTFPLSAVREKNFIAGCSMGGFGALRLGLTQAESWSAIGAFSCAHIVYRPNIPRVQAVIQPIYDGAMDACDAQTEAAALLDNVSGPELRIWHAWGDADALRRDALISQAFFDALPKRQIHYRCTEFSGRHDWALWDDMAARFIDWLELPTPEVHLF